MDDLSRTARLVEEVIRRVLRRYQERMLADDHHRRVMDDALAELPGIVKDVVRKVENESVDPDAPGPYDLSSSAVLGRRRSGKRV